MKGIAQGFVFLARYWQVMKRVSIRLRQVLGVRNVCFSIFLLCFFSLLGMMGGPAVSAEEERVEITPEQMQEWEEKGIDPNHTEVVEHIRTYIEENIEGGIFAGMYIDRAERSLGTLVFSFTEPIAEEDEQAMRELAEEPAQIQIREVTYTEEELQRKQQEIDEDVFAGDGLKEGDFAVYHTSVDVIGNQVQVGIDPFHEENAQIVYDRYGEEMIEVVQGHQATTLDGIATEASEASFAVEEELDDQANEASEASEVNEIKEANEKDLNILQRFLQSVLDWFAAFFAY